MREKISLAFIFYFLIFCVKSSNAQVVVFQKHNSSKHKLYLLPLDVKCGFKNGKIKKLIIENIKGDSIHFRKYYNQSNYDCAINDIDFIRINRKLNPLRDITILTGCIIMMKNLIDVSANYTYEPELTLYLSAVVITFFGGSTLLFSTLTKNTFKSKKYEIKTL